MPLISNMCTNMHYTVFSGQHFRSKSCVLYSRYYSKLCLCNLFTSNEYRPIVTMVFDIHFICFFIAQFFNLVLVVTCGIKCKCGIIYRNSVCLSVHSLHYWTVLKWLNVLPRLFCLWQLYYATLSYCQTSWQKSGRSVKYSCGVNKLRMFKIYIIMSWKHC